MTLDIHYAPTANGWKPTIMIEELREAGVALPEVNFHVVDIANGEQFGVEFGKITLNRKIPVIVHDGTAIMESCAGLQYLAETFPSPLMPTDARKWEVIPWLYWQAANLGPAFGNKLSYTRYIDIPENEKRHPIERFSTEGLRLMTILDERLAKAPYVCGAQFTVADISIFPWVRAYKWVKLDITGFEHVMAWLERCRARPGVARGVAYGVPTDETDKFSKERREQYRKGGAAMASNENIKSTT